MYEYIYIYIYIYIYTHTHMCVCVCVCVSMSILWASQVVLVAKNLPANAGDAGDVGLIPGLGRWVGEEHGSPLQYSWLENPMDRRAWRATVHGVTKC